MTLTPASKDVNQAVAALDQFALDLLAVTYEYDHYFPGLATHPLIVEFLEQRLPSRIAAARNGLVAKPTSLPVAAYCAAQLSRLNEELLDTLEVEEAVLSICNMGDLFYYWLRQNEVIGAEQVRVCVLLRRDNQILLVKPAAGSCKDQWTSINGETQLGESLQQSALHNLKDALAVDISEVSDTIGQSYDYFDNTDELVLSVFMIVECPLEQEPVMGAACKDMQWFSSEDLPEPLSAPLATAIVDGMDLQEEVVLAFV